MVCISAMSQLIRKSFIVTEEGFKIPVSCYDIPKTVYIQLHKLYYGEESTVKFQSFKKILHRTRQLGLAIKPNVVKRFLESQNTYSMYTRQKNSRKFIPMSVYGLSNIHQIDLAFFPGLEHANKGYIGILIIIDCLSRKGYYFPIKNKKSSHIGGILRKFYKGFVNRPMIQSDSGTEFKGYTSQVFKKLKMTHKILSSENKASYVERLIRTIRAPLHKLISEHGDSNWAVHMQSVFDNYNNSIHSAIGMCPNDVTSDNSHQVLLNSAVLRKHDYEDEKILKLGSFVRTSIIEKKFHKGSWPVFSGEIFRILKRRLNFRPRQYALSDLNNCLIEGWFTNNDLKLLDYSFLEINCMMEIENIVREFQMNGVRYLEIKHRYYDSSFNSLVRKDLFEKFNVF